MDDLNQLLDQFGQGLARLDAIVTRMEARDASALPAPKPDPIPQVEDEATFIAKVRVMEEQELCERIIGQWRHLGNFLHCLAGLEIPAPYAKSSGTYFPEEIRELVAGLLARESAPEPSAVQIDRVQLAARQCERMARFFADGSPGGDSKAAGYRHAVHIFRTIGRLPLADPAHLRHAEDLPGTVDAPELFPLP
jgi:hypothetical protein